eukprot:TRINITY_DN57427_c0_g1_i1.p1 TRINITY_DN57427_c0_g1~~TRINITY_DN57427_c0_g1_i1.p1  ORF type:complete len:402 (+),score=76.50 TRINITY_DN57427_c0_g1_i1:154-1359(+)
MANNLVGPADAPFRQQRLPAWQPILSPPYVISCFLLVAGIFIPIGGVIISASARVQEITIEYDDAGQVDPLTGNLTGRSCADVLQEQVFDLKEQPSCLSRITFVPSTRIPAPVYMYYRLTNFYQNHRRFAMSRYDNQLAGDAVSPGSSDLEEACGPLATFVDPNTLQRRVINPCGLIAWSMFNDTFVLMKQAAGGPSLVCNTSVPSQAVCDRVAGLPRPLTNNSGDEYYANLCQGSSGVCRKDGIAWASDREKKFQQDTAYQMNADYLSFPNFYPGTYDGNNLQGHRVPDANDEDLMVWMRTAAMPTFRKLLRVIRDPLQPNVQYELLIHHQYPVKSFQGTKAIVLANNEWIGGRNEFLGGAYIAVGAVCALLAGLFLLQHILRPRSPGDLAFFPGYSRSQ